MSSDAGDLRAELLEEHLLEGNPIRFRARGGSMAPMIRDGTVLHVVPLDRWRVGDVLLGERSGTWIAHRLVSMSDAAVVLRGDAMAQPDPPLPRTSVLGRVARVEIGGFRISVDGWAGRLLSATALLSIRGRALLPRAVRSVRSMRSMASRDRNRHAT